MTRPQNTSLKKATQDYFEQVSLSDTELSQLNTLLQQHSKHTKENTCLDSKHKTDESSVNYHHQHATNQQSSDSLFNASAIKKRPWYHYASVACVLMAFFVTLDTLSTKYDVIPKQTSMLVAEEVANNHLHFNPLEIQTNSFEQVANYFNSGKISFKPIPSELLKVTMGNKLSLLGGRFCSLRNTNASLIRYQAPQNHTLTFYQVGYDAKKFGNIPSVDHNQAPMESFVSGMKVNLWVEKGLLMASAVDATCNI